MNGLRGTAHLFVWQVDRALISRIKIAFWSMRSSNFLKRFRVTGYRRSTPHDLFSLRRPRQANRRIVHGKCFCDSRSVHNVGPHIPIKHFIEIVHDFFFYIQRRPFMRAPVCAADLGPHFAVQKVAYLPKMTSTRAQSPPPSISMILETIP